MKTKIKPIFFLNRIASVVTSIFSLFAFLLILGILVTTVFAQESNAQEVQNVSEAEQEARISSELANTRLQFERNFNNTEFQYPSTGETPNPIRKSEFYGSEDFQMMKQLHDLVAHYREKNNFTKYYDYLNTYTRKLRLLSKPLVGVVKFYKGDTIPGHRFVQDEVWMYVFDSKISSQLLAYVDSESDGFIYSGEDNSIDHAAHIDGNKFVFLNIEKRSPNGNVTIGEIPYSKYAGQHVFNVCTYWYYFNYNFLKENQNFTPFQSHPLDERFTQLCGDWLGLATEE